MIKEKYIKIKYKLCDIKLLLNRIREGNSGEINNAFTNNTDEGGKRIRIYC